ncbi:MAG: site-2 protease family protein [Peptococcaceae bacterium]|nr:site-2 protease family protein [Peptococcaceae bacterium]
MFFEMLDSLVEGNFAVVSMFLLAGAFILLVALPIHELAHAVTAYRLGDPTAKRLGRLTFNPKAHLDPMGAIFIMIAGFGWAKPVPIDMRNFRNPKQGMAISALAGPVSNVLMAFFLVALYTTLIYPNSAGLPLSSEIFSFFYFAVSINLMLAAFNLIPLPPLDGSHIMKAFLPPRLYYSYTQIEKYAPFIIILLFITGILSGPIMMIRNGLLSLICLPFKWLGFTVPFLELL